MMEGNYQRKNLILYKCKYQKTKHFLAFIDTQKVIYDRRGTFSENFCRGYESICVTIHFIDYNFYF